jgi:hypothetical protein
MEKTYQSSADGATGGCGAAVGEHAGAPADAAGTTALARARSAESAPSQITTKSAAVSVGFSVVSVASWVAPPARLPFES